MLLFEKVHIKYGSVLELSKTCGLLSTYTSTGDDTRPARWSTKRPQSVILQDVQWAHGIGRERIKEGRGLRAEFSNEGADMTCLPRVHKHRQAISPQDLHFLPYYTAILKCNESTANKWYHHWYFLIFFFFTSFIYITVRCVKQI